jgi:hypothetical protein
LAVFARLDGVARFRPLLLRLPPPPTLARAEDGRCGVPNRSPSINTVSTSRIRRDGAAVDGRSRTAVRYAGPTEVPPRASADMGRELLTAITVTARLA